jgi:DNA-binding transcriptional ArsR family regulator
MIEIFVALAETNRLQIVELLAQQPYTVLDIASRLDLRQTQTSKHLKVLREAGLVNVEVSGQHRRYSLEPKRFAEIDQWLVKYRHLWEERFEQLDHVLAELMKQEPSNVKKRRRRKPDA